MFNPCSNHALRNERATDVVIGKMHKTLTRALWHLGIVAFLAIGTPSHATAKTTPEQEQDTTATETKLQNAIDNLANIQQSIDSKRKTIRELREKLKRPEDTSEKLEIEQKIERAQNEIASLQASFEHIALGGVNLSSLDNQPEQKINWQDEIEQVIRPLLSTLKEVTEKPRRIDSLHRDIERLEDQLALIEKALSSIQRFKLQKLPPPAVAPINQLQADWEQRRNDTLRTLEITQFKLTSLETEGTGWKTSAGEAISEFLHGRGLTLLLAMMLGLAVWLASKGMIKLYWRWLYQAPHDIGITRAPLFYYSYRLTTAIIIVLSVLMVFYVRGDVLLLSLALIALAGAALTLRQTLPRYTAELRLLLGVGPVREDERLVLDGIPFRVDSLNVYSVLRNPSLEGLVRLPLRDMNALASRPSSQEPWFPCEPGEYIVLADGSYGRVLRQTIELVEIAILDSLVQIRTKDFVGQSVRNLSRDGFGIACSFGIDYQHQEICLDTVPGRFRENIILHFEKAGLKENIADILVELSQAGASSLDYRIYMILKGGAAHTFYKSQRLVQQACVATCNQENWVIPFTQITVHASHATHEPESIIKSINDPVEHESAESAPSAS